MKNIILIGMPAAGKSTVGVIVAKRLGYDFLDTDILIQRQEGRLLSEIIEEDGIEAFLKIENQVNQDVTVERTVIAPGGSVVYCKEAMEHYGETGVVVYLRTSFAAIERRIRNAKRRGVVLREGQTMKMLYEERTKLFEKYADITIDEEGKSLDETIECVLEAVKTRHKSVRK